jgi:hypothetical protein
MQCGGERWRPGGGDGEGKPIAGDVDYIGEDGGKARRGDVGERRGVDFLVLLLLLQRCEALLVLLLGSAEML